MANDQNPMFSFKTSDIDDGSHGKINIPKPAAGPNMVKTQLKMSFISELPKYGAMVILNPAIRPYSKEFSMGEKGFEGDLKDRLDERNNLEGEKVLISTMFEESYLRIFFPFDYLVDESQSQETSIITMIEP